MGTITQRINKNGQTKYTVQIRLRRNGVIVYQESQSFDRKAVARAWMTRREAELGMPGALDRAALPGVPIKTIIERYLEEHELIRPLGKTKRTTLNAIGQSWLGDVADGFYPISTDGLKRAENFRSCRGDSTTHSWVMKPFDVVE